MARHTLSKIEPGHGPMVPEDQWERAGMTPNGRQLFKEQMPVLHKYPDLDMEGERKLQDLKIELAEAKRVSVDEIDFEYGDGIPEDFRIRYDFIVRRHRVWARHFQTDQKLYPRNDHKVVWVERMFFVESDGQFNQYKHIYTPPSPEELAALERAGKAGELLEELSGMIVDMGMDAESFLHAVRAGRAVLDQEDEEPAMAVPTPDEDEGVPDAADDAQASAEAADDAEEDVEYPVNLGFGRWELSNGTVIEDSKKPAALKAEEQIQEKKKAMSDIPEV